MLCRGSIWGQRRWKENTFNQVSLEEVRDETSGGVEGREGGKRTLSTESVSSVEVRDETSGGEGREGGKRTLSTESVSSEVEEVQET